ncbi:hypothetical protein CTAYLR_004346 [Chrysophaeum taylorii]|uniref:Uncharacterized protein n=1 Tax=Chrysophaeum taylorii TaxID=2483200 RepID=A0AAD7UMG6_9STRA|nr:hypothetical protein CTAYLR_004346 [Chrysophaeum taylorii]
MIIMFFCLVPLAAAFFAPPPRLPTSARRLQRAQPVAFFESFFPNQEADARLDALVSSSKAVLLTDASGASTSIRDGLKAAKVGNFKEIRLDQEADSKALIGSLRRRVGTAPPTLIVGGAVFDQKRIDYLVRQDMMLPVFRAAGTSGELRLPFQDLRFYLAKTIRE